SCAQSHGAGIGDVDEAAETKYPIIKIVGVANKRAGVTCQPVRDVSEVVAEVNKPGGLECSAWRAEAVDQVVDAVGGAGGAIRRDGVDRALPILAFEVTASSGERRVHRATCRHINLCLRRGGDAQGRHNCEKGW